MTKRERPGRDGWKHVVKVPTRWSDNDAYGHVNNTVYYSWFDTVVNAWLIGQGLLDIQEGAGINLVVETSCAYFESIAYPETVEVGLRVTRIGTSSIEYGLAVFREGEPLAAAVGRFVHVHVLRGSGKPAPIPPRMREALATLSD